MTTYSHHIAGRLRTRYPQLKNNPARARAVEAALRRIDGVLSAEASTVTGSLLIRYEPGVPGREALLDTVYATKERLGLTATAISRTASAPAAAVPATLGGKVVDKALDMLIEKCIERSTYALFAALL